MHDIYAICNHTTSKVFIFIQVNTQAHFYKKEIDTIGKSLQIGRLATTDSSPSKLVNRDSRHT